MNFLKWKFKNFPEWKTFLSHVNAPQKPHSVKERLIPGLYKKALTDDISQPLSAYPSLIRERITEKHWGHVWKLFLNLQHLLPSLKFIWPLLLLIP